MDPAIAIALGACLASSPGPQEATVEADDASTEPVAQQGLGRGLVVRVDPDLPQAEAVQGWIEERGQAVLSLRARPLGEGDLIRVVVRGAPFDYRIHIQLRHQGRQLDDQPDALQCECGSDQMLEEIGLAIDEAADRLEAADEADELMQTKQRREPQQVDVEQESPPAVPQSRRVLSSLGWVGITGGIIGSGLVIAGASMLHVSNGDSGREEWDTPGLAMAGSGAGLVLLGITFIAIDVVRCKRHPEQCSGRTRQERRRKDVALAGSRWRAAHRGRGEPTASGGRRW